MTGYARGPDIVTLVQGTSFVVCCPDGEIRQPSAQGYYVGDTRVLSSLRLRIDRQEIAVLQHRLGDERLHCTGIVGDPTAPALLIERTVELDDGLLLHVAMENLTSTPHLVTVELVLDADFADIFEVRRAEVARRGFVGSGLADGAFQLQYRSDGFERTLRVHPDPPMQVLRDGLVVDLELDPFGRRTITVRLEASKGDAPAFPPLPRGEPTASPWCDVPALRAAPPTLESAWKRSVADVGSLLLVDPDDPSRPIVAAGSPWFMALFGRDSLLTSWSCLPLCPELAIGVLQALAARQGRTEVPSTNEEAGRILHEVRRGEEVQRSDGWGEVYYGSVDATPLFAMTIGELARWGAPHGVVEALMPAAERAVEWVLGKLGSDPNGFLTYPGRSTRTPGLVNQAWKDSDDAVVRPDGTVPQGPIAMVEVQGYCHAALLALAELREAGRTGDPEPLRAQARDLADRIDDRYWLPDEDCYAMAVAGDGEPVASVASNAGHLLWTGTARPERAEALAARLSAPDLFSGFGIRTLSSHHRAYNPLAYHRGSVWPHDTALVAAGLLRYGYVEQGRAVALALFDAAATSGGRLPELFGGFDRDREPAPVPYPTSCSPQAWSAAAPFLLIRALLGMEPDARQGVIRLTTPPGASPALELDGIRIAGGRLSLRAGPEAVEVLECPPALRVDGTGR